MNETNTDEINLIEINDFIKEDKTDKKKSKPTTTSKPKEEKFSTFKKEFMIEVKKYVKKELNIKNELNSFSIKDFNKFLKKDEGNLNELKRILSVEAKQKHWSNRFPNTFQYLLSTGATKINLGKMDGNIEKLIVDITPKQQKKIFALDENDGIINDIVDFGKITTYKKVFPKIMWGIINWSRYEKFSNEFFLDEHYFDNYYSPLVDEEYDMGEKKCGVFNYYYNNFQEIVDFLLEKGIINYKADINQPIYSYGHLVIKKIDSLKLLRRLEKEFKFKDDDSIYR